MVYQTHKELLGCGCATGSIIRREEMAKKKPTKTNRHTKKKAAKKKAAKRTINKSRTNILVPQNTTGGSVSTITLTGQSLNIDEPNYGEIKQLKDQIGRLNRKIKKQADGSILIEHAMHEAVHSLDYNPPELPKPKIDKRKNISKEIAVLHISDTQIGKITTTYNSAVAVHRLELLVDKTIEITTARRKNAKIEEIHVILGGDIVEGEQIFPHQAHLIDQAVINQAMSAAGILAAIVERLLCVYRKVKVICVKGNHGRNGPRHNHGHPDTNWDVVCYQHTENLLKTAGAKSRYSGRLEFIISKEFYYVDYTYDWGHLIVHGDQISGGGAGFPWPGVARKIFKWADSITQAWDYMWMGHFHTLNSGVFNHKMLLANGTTESDNEFALEQLASQGEPVQRLAFFNKKKGLICDYPVYLSEAGDRLPTLKRYERALQQAK